jgi:6,7-dimethyl-8-ribityllumazine synthase
MQLHEKPEIKIDAAGKRVGVVTSRFNREITDQLLASAKQQLQASNVQLQDCKFVSVAGAMEIPFALKKLASSGKFDCLVAIGCVIKGETPHFDYVCKMAQEGVLKVSLDHAIPVGFGVITVNTLEQARARLHVGGEAALAALELAVTNFE